MYIPRRKAGAADAEKIPECCKAVGGEADSLTFGPEDIAMTVELDWDHPKPIRHFHTQLYPVAEESGTPAVFLIGCRITVFHFSGATFRASDR